MYHTRVFRFITVNGPVEVELACSGIDMTPLREGVARLKVDDPKLKRKLEAKVAKVAENVLDQELLLSALER